MSNSSRLAKNTIFLYFRQILIMLVSLYTVRVVLNSLGATDFGIYNVVAGIVTMFSFLSGVMATASNRYLSFDLGRKEFEKLKKTFSLLVTIYLFIAVFILLMAETVGLWFILEKMTIPSSRMSSAIWVYQFSVMSFIFTILTIPYISCIIAHENMNVYAYISIVEVFLKLSIALLLPFFDVDKLWLYGLLMFVVTIVNTTIYRTICKRNYSECIYHFIWDLKYAKEMFGFAGWNLFGALATIFKGLLVNILLNQFFNPIVNAANGIASQVNTAIRSFASNFSTALKPQIIKKYATNQLAETIRLTLQGSKYTFFLMWVFALPLFFEMDIILLLWLKNPPGDVVLFTRLALIDNLFAALSLPLQTLAQATGQIKLYQSFVGSLLLLNFPISWIVLKMGAPAYSVFIVAILISFLATISRIIIIRKLVFYSLRYFITSVITPCLLVSVFTLITAIALKLILPEGYLYSLASILLNVIIIIAIIAVFGMSKNERFFIKKVIKNKLKKVGN